MAKGNKITIGWKEQVAFPEWDNANIIAKVDTGALSSSLDVSHIEILPGGKVRFNIVLSKSKRSRIKTITAPIIRISSVKTSPIHNEKRVFVKTKVTIGTLTKDIELNLVDRSDMTYRMLLGRSVLRGDFVVDVSHRRMMK